MPEFAGGRPTEPTMEALLRARIRDRGGKIPFSEFMDLALYAPGIGYYRGPKVFGKEGDFMTAPRVHPIFGWTVARAVRDVWEALGQPLDMTLAELGPGENGLVRGVLEGLQRLGVATSGWEVLLCDRSERKDAYADLAGSARVKWIPPGSSIPPFRGVVLANELLDALPFHRFRKDAAGWSEAWVRWEESRKAFDWSFEPVPKGRWEDALPPEVPSGTVVELPEGLEELLLAIRKSLTEGVVLFFDYGGSQEELLQRFPEGSLSTFRRHDQGEDPFDAPGTRDLSAWVNFSYVARLSARCGFRVEGPALQSEFLHHHQIEEAVRELERKSSFEGVKARMAMKSFFFSYRDHRVLTLRC